MTYPDLFHPSLPDLLIALKLGLLVFFLSSIARRVTGMKTGRVHVPGPSRHSRHQR
ncbi:MAG: hypothetical protein R3179_03285 [Sedimenticolaceae bacterium]|nr:hypothetical protein [Sedimenticolaceae bacterium]